MRTVKLLGLAAAMLAAAAATSIAAINEDLESGPAAGTKVKELKAVAIAEEGPKEAADVLAERKNKPTILVLVQADKWDRPVARFLKTLDQKLVERNDEARLLAVWLTDDQEKSKEYLPKAQQSLKLEKTVWAVFTGDKGGPEGWEINLNAGTTAIVLDGLSVLKSVGYRSLNETDVDAVMKKLPAKK
ncbi:MAG TPA: hypothetical protein VNC50_01015 [Planctomycetia bacterium]|nr:hypothetical protein [Planctomycetia bacterium]